MKFIIHWLSSVMGAIFRVVYQLSGNFYLCLILVACLMTIPDLIMILLKTYYQKKSVVYYPQIAEIKIKYPDPEYQKAKINALRIKRTNFPLQLFAGFMRYFLYVSTFFVLRHPEDYFTFLPENSIFPFLYIPDMFEIHFDLILPLFLAILSAIRPLFPFSKQAISSYPKSSLCIMTVSVTVLYLMLSVTTARMYFVMRLFILVLQYGLRILFLPVQKQLQQEQEKALNEARQRLKNATEQIDEENHPIETD